jgi:hypothetical protein
LWVVFGVFLSAFILSQYFCIFTTPEQRIFPVQFLKRRTIFLCFIATNCAATSFFVIVYYLPVYFQFVHGDTGLESAVRLLPVVITFVALNMINGALMPTLGYYLPWYIAAGVLITTGGGESHSLFSREHIQYVSH